MKSPLYLLPRGIGAEVHGMSPGDGNLGEVPHLGSVRGEVPRCGDSPVEVPLWGNQVGDLNSIN